MKLNKGCCSTQCVKILILLLTKTGLDGILNSKSTDLLPFSLSYLFKVVSQKDKIDTAESQLRDNQEEVHQVPVDGEGRNTKIMRMKKQESPRERCLNSVSSQDITDPSHQVTRMSVP